MDLSSHHRSFFNNPYALTPTHWYRFLRNVYQADKWRELISYLRWEIKHRLGLFQTNRYLTFTDHTPVFLNSSSDSVDTITSVRIRKALHPWRMRLQNSSGQVWGCLFGNDFSLYSLSDVNHSIHICYQFTHPIQSIYLSARSHLYVCCQGQLYRSTDKGKSFEQVLTLSSTSSYFLFNNGMTELPDGRLLLGEYGVVREQKSWQNLAHVYYAANEGQAWQKTDFLIRDGVNKHVHLVKYSLFLNALILTDGDNKKQIWCNRSLSRLDQAANGQNDGWHRLNKSHYQMGGYLSMTELNGTVFLGSDYLGGTNFLVTTQDGSVFTKQVIPDPYRRSPVMDIVRRKQTNGQVELWAVLHNSIASSTRSLLMVSADNGLSWRKIIDYDGTTHEIKLVSSSARLIDELYFVVITQKGGHSSQSVFVVSDN
ncbi:exo-alpha-sialidase [Spirosoma sp. SC4-14]|uniref:exo-alpha-sialidase n=1 Tax=Spirosoma sp. SC4-14 TaxID=3128900 RepID=UPI0030D1EA1A